MGKDWISTDEIHGSISSRFEDFSDEDLNYERQIDDLISYIESVNSQELLEKLSIEASLSAVASQTSAISDGIGHPPSLLRYVEGLILVYGGDGNNPVDYNEFLSKSLSVADARSNSMIIERSEQNIEENKQSLVKFYQALRDVGSSRYAFSEQPIEAAQRAYSPHDKKMKKEVGFTINDAIKCENIIEKVVSKLRSKAIMESEIKPSDIDLESNYMTRMMSSAREEDKLTLHSESEAVDRTAELVTKVYHTTPNKDALWFSDSMLTNIIDGVESIEEEKLQSFLSRMSLKIGEGNTVIPDNLSDFKYPSEFNPLDRNPMIRCCGQYHLIIADFLRYAMWNTFYYDLIDHDGSNGDSNGGGEFGNKYGDYIEEWSEEMFLKTFNTNDVHFEPEYVGTDKEAADLIITNDEFSTLFTIECKAGTIPVTITPDDYESIEEPIKRKIGEAYNQALDFISRINDTGISEKIKSIEVDDISHISASNDELIEITGYDHHIPLVIVGDVYDILATSNMDTLLEVKELSPHVIDILDLQVLTEVIDRPSRFLDYINKRRGQIHSDTSIIGMDEIDYLGLYVKSTPYPYESRVGDRYDFPSIPDDAFLPLLDQSEVIIKNTSGKFGI